VSAKNAHGGGAGSFTVTPVLDRTQLFRLNNAVQRAGKEAQKELKAQLRQVGQVMRTEVGERVPVGSGPGGGKLRRGTRVNVDIRNNQFKVEIRNDTQAVSRAWPRGYRYGKRLEFDPRFAGRYAFWYPAWEAVKPRIRFMFDEVLEKAYKAFVKG
jgi:hypothetical protein